MPSYKRKLQKPVWAVYENDKLIATIREGTKEEAEVKFVEAGMLPEGATVEALRLHSSDGRAAES